MSYEPQSQHHKIPEIPIPSKVESRICISCSGRLFHIKHLSNRFGDSRVLYHIGIVTYLTYCLPYEPTRVYRELGVNLKPQTAINEHNPSC